jgi:hypothetical protein
MVGGIVAGIARGEQDTLLNIEDKVYSVPDVCAVRVIERRIDNSQSIEIGIGDSIWWQSGRCYWTPKATKDAGIDPGVDCGKTWDIALPKVGYSH